MYKRDKTNYMICRKEIKTNYMICIKEIKTNYIICIKANLHNLYVKLKIKIRIFDQNYVANERIKNVPNICLVCS